MSGISDKAIKTNYATNKYRYNSKELQNQEFSDGSGLEEYDYGARMQDPQLGVWHGIDPHLEFYESVSPYSYCFNSPIRYFDNSGEDPGDIIIFFTGANIGQSPTASTGWMMNKVSRFINGGETYRYRSRPFGEKYWKTNTQDAYDAILDNQGHYPTGRVVIYGYSYGGQLANYLAKRLQKIGIKVDLLITVDAAAGMESWDVDRRISNNVSLNVNFFEFNLSIDPLPNHGSFNDPESKDKTVVLNFHMSWDTYIDDNGKEHSINHTNIDEASKSASVNYIMSALPPRSNKPRPISLEEFLNAAGVSFQLVV